MEKSEVSALEKRTNAMINYARLMREELQRRPSEKGRGDPFERAHEEAVLFHVIGAKDAFLHEINAAYNLGLTSAKVSENNLDKALARKGKTCPALQKLMKIEKDKSSWLYQAIPLWNLGTHRTGLTRTFLLVENLTGKPFIGIPEIQVSTSQKRIPIHI